MVSPVQISDLPPLSPVPANALMLVRSGLTDYQALVSAVRSLNIVNDYTEIDSPQASDVMLISRVVSGTPTNYKVRFDKVGFIQNTVMWFYTSTTQPPSNWVLVAGTGDRLLGLQGGSTYTTAPSLQGNWAIPGTALTVNQIPNHSHKIALNNIYRNGEPYKASYVQNNGTAVLEESQGVTGSTNNLPSNQCLEHTHPNYRPAVAVGNLFSKFL